MTLSDRDQAIRALVVESMWGRGEPSYADKKHVIESLDEAYIRQEVDKLESKNHILSWVLTVGGVLVALVWSLDLMLDGGFQSGAAVAVSQMMFLLALAFLGYRLRSDHAKRLFAFKVLDLLASSEEPSRLMGDAARV